MREIRECSPTMAVYYMSYTEQGKMYDVYDTLTTRIARRFALQQGKRGLKCGTTAGAEAVRHGRTGRCCDYMVANCRPPRPGEPPR